MGGTMAVPPVAMTAAANSSVLPLTSMEFLDVNLARPYV